MRTELPREPMAMVSTTGATRLGWVCLSVLVAGEADRREALYEYHYSFRVCTGSGFCDFGCILLGCEDVYKETYLHHRVFEVGLSWAFSWKCN